MKWIWEMSDKRTRHNAEWEQKSKISHSIKRNKAQRTRIILCLWVCVCILRLDVVCFVNNRKLRFSLEFVVLAASNWAIAQFNGRRLINFFFAFQKQEWSDFNSVYVDMHRSQFCRTHYTCVRKKRISIVWNSNKQKHFFILFFSCFFYFSFWNFILIGENTLFDCFTRHSFNTM